MTPTPSHQLVQLLQRPSQSADAIYERQLGSQGVTARQWTVLAMVAESSDATNQINLTRRTGIDRSTMADVIRRLLDRGLIRRRQSERDGRAYEIILTPRGKQMVAAGTGLAQQVQVRLLEALSTSQRQEIGPALQALTDLKHQTLIAISPSRSCARWCADSEPDAGPFWISAALCDREPGGSNSNVGVSGSLARPCDAAGNEPY